MDRKAQALVVTLWVVLSLTVLAVSIGHRVSIGLRLSSYQRDKLKAFYLAKAAVNRVIAEINNDSSPEYDSLGDKWADNEEIFKKISFTNGNEYASVGYNIVDAYDEIKIIYGVVDEERKININTASPELLDVLFEESEIDWAARDLINNILIWRGDLPDAGKIYENLGYVCKSGRFKNIEELILVKGMTWEDIEKLRKNITVYTEGSININTVSPELLKIVARASAKRLSVGYSFAESVADKIFTLRNEKKYFENKEAIAISTTGDEELNIFNDLLANVVLKSDNFFIAANGNSGKIKREIISVYNRKDKRMEYWHEI